MRLVGRGAVLVRHGTVSLWMNVWLGTVPRVGVLVSMVQPDTEHHQQRCQPKRPTRHGRPDGKSDDHAEQRRHREVRAGPGVPMTSGPRRRAPGQSVARKANDECCSNGSGRRHSSGVSLDGKAYIAMRRRLSVQAPGRLVHFGLDRT
jgi:hypothetical protein